MAKQDAAAEANLGQTTNEEWLAGHRALMALGAVPAGELAYLYAPARDPADVTVDDLTPLPDPKEPTDD